MVLSGVRSNLEKYIKFMKARLNDRAFCLPLYHGFIDLVQRILIGSRMTGQVIVEGKSLNQ